MNKEDKELLLRDLCARLPYGVKVHIKGEYKTPRTIHVIYIENKIVGYFKGFQYEEERIEDVKPYLRPLSSMTREECIQLSIFLPKYYIIYSDQIHNLGRDGRILPEHIETIIDFYNIHHLDWRGLIPKGLALEAPEDMYKFQVMLNSNSGFCMSDGSNCFKCSLLKYCGGINKKFKYGNKI